MSFPDPEVHVSTCSNILQCRVTYLGVMCPLIPQLIEDIDVSKRTKHTTHEARFAQCLLNGTEAISDHALGTNNTSNRASDLAQHVESSGSDLLAGRHGVRKVLDRLQTRVHNGHRYHPYAVLDTWWQCRHLGEYALIRWPGHDLMRIALRSAIGPYHCDAGTKVLDEVPPSASDCEKIHVVADIAEDLESGVVLEEQVHLDTESSNVLEHVGKLHVLWVRTEAIEAG